jgi:ribosomal protein L11 methyltransferase
MNHIEVRVPVTDTDLQDIIIASLAEEGYDGFEQDEQSVKAFIKQTEFDENKLLFILNEHYLKYSFSIIKNQNWNQLWESNFDPVLVGDFVGIRAHFHEPLLNVDHEIVITPKMSFGTGHHATTFMVVELMQKIDFQDKSVFDMGTGTGILAILAERLGAQRILAVDYDDNCIENASENIVNNICNYIEIQKLDTAEVNEKFDIIIANINKNIIIDNLDFLSNDVTKGGQVILSGLLTEDENDILHATDLLGWKHIETRQKGMWIAIRFDC